MTTSDNDNIIEFPNRIKEQETAHYAVLDGLATQLQILEDQKQEIRQQRKELQKLLHRNKFYIVPKQ